jgi:phage-related protein
MPARRFAAGHGSGDHGLGRRRGGDGDTYRAVYTIKFAGVVYVLHAFQKKSKKGIATPQREIRSIEERLKRAEVHYRSHYRKGTET